MSALYELALALNYSVIDSVLCHRRSHLLFNFQVAGGSLGWQVAGRCLSQKETGDRMIGWGCISQVTGDGRGLREFRRQPFGSRPQDTDYRWPKRRFLMA